MLIERKCINCESLFITRQADIDRGHGKFCSKKCFFLLRSKNAKIRRIEIESIPNAKCDWCKILYYRKKFDTSKHGFFFCSRKCKDNAQKIGGIKEIQPSHYGDECTSYRKIAFENFKNECVKCGYKENSYALEVHHKDENRKNNNISNLEILCCNCHTIIHLSK